MNQGANADAGLTVPIFGLAGDDPLPVAFGTVEAAEACAEPWDIEDGLWTFWDSTGRRLEARPRNGTRSRTELVATDVIEEGRLRSLLLCTAERIGLDHEDLGSASAANLAAALAEPLAHRRPLAKRKLWIRDLPAGVAEGMALIAALAAFASAWFVAQSLITRGLLNVLGALCILAMSAIERIRGHG